MRKLLLLTALLGTLCVWGCASEAMDTDTSVTSAPDTVLTVVTTPATPSQSTPGTTASTGLPDTQTTESVTNEPPVTPGQTTTGKAPDTEAPKTTEKPTTTVPDTKPTTTTTTKKQTTTVKPTTTPKPVTTTQKPVTTTKPVTTDPGPAKGTPINVRYNVNSSSAGSLSGNTNQTIRYGETKTTTVTAKANLGYKFVKWSDGVTTATRSAESPVKSGTLTAIFEYDTMGLPVISISTETGSDPTSRDVYIGGKISISNCDADYILENYEMQIRGRGNYTWTESKVAKKSWRVKLSTKQNLLGQGEGKAKDWTLIANHCDQSLIRNFITLNYARKLEGISFMSSAISVDVYMNGEYRGVYLLCEQNEVQKNRVNITENPESVKTGYLIEMTGYAKDPMFKMYMPNEFKFEIKNDLSTMSTTTYNAQFRFAQDFINQCWKAVESGNESQIRKLIDIESVVDTYIVEELFKNLDAGWDSFYMYFDNGLANGDVLHFGPIWDFDLSGGNVDEPTNCDKYEGLRAGTIGCNPWYGKLLEQIWFRKLVTERWNELKGETDKIPAEIIAEATAHEKAYSRNFDRWQIFGQQINREPAVIRALRTYKEHYEYYAQWMVNRIEWLDNYFNGPTYSFDGKLSLKGSGTKTSPYLVSTPADFMNFTLCMANGQSFAGKYFRQTANIDMTKLAGYAGVGAPNTFAGIYDGAGYTINVKLSGQDQCIFPYLTGTVMNLFTTGSINNTVQAAGICRSVRQGGKIVNCGSSMTLTGEYAGGIAASNQTGGGLIAGCVFTGSVAGNKVGASASPINCYSDGRGGSYVGNIYLIGVTHTTSDADWNTAKNETAMAKKQMANALNNGLPAAANAAGVAESELCQWTTQNGNPVMQAK